MDGASSVDEVREAVRDGGLFARDRRLLAMVSGGRDSTCLLDVAVALLGASAVFALHVNYGLRDAAESDELACRDLCRSLGVELEVLKADAAGAPSPPGGEGAGGEKPGGEESGNLQTWAREIRYAEATGWRRRRDALIATGHTASDQAETVLYRLAASPGRRALLGMSPSEGRLVRPLLTVTRRADGGVLPRPRAQLAARTRATRIRASPVPASGTACCPPCRSFIPRRKPTSCARPPSCAPRRSCSTGSSTLSSKDAHRFVWLASASCPRRSHG